MKVLLPALHLTPQSKSKQYVCLRSFFVSFRLEEELWVDWYGNYFLLFFFCIAQNLSYIWFILP